MGHRFVIRRIRLNFQKAIAANMTITPTVFVDDFSSSSTTGLRTINNTNYSKSEQFVEFMPNINGKRNFVLELRHSGTALLPVTMPIEIDVEVLTD